MAELFFSKNIFVDCAAARLIFFRRVLENFAAYVEQKWSFVGEAPLMRRKTSFLYNIYVQIFLLIFLVLNIFEITLNLKKNVDFSILEWDWDITSYDSSSEAT